MAKKIFTFAAVFAFFLGCADVPEELREEAEGKCSGRAYTEYQFCAGGQVYDFCDGTPYNPSTVGCCNNRQYTISTEFCSQNYIYRRCGGREYDFSTQFCSGDGVYDKCNGQSYTPSAQFCGYNGGGYGVYNKCGGEEYSPSSQGCQNGAVMNKCGSNYYNPSTQFCNENSVYPLCNSKTYYPSYQKCQSGVVMNKCGSDWYNPEVLFCSDNSVYNKCGGKTYWPSEQRCQGDVVETKCGNWWYDATNQRCQGNVIETKCGDDGWYDASNSNLRCQSSVVEAKCGTTWYNTSTQFCGIDSEVYTLCGGNDYNPATQFCHTDNTVHNKCNGSNYNASTQYCSDGTLKSYGSVTDDGGRTYKTVVIGSQTWMAENLNYDKGTDGSVCYDNKASNCDKYGRLYDWATAMGISSDYKSSFYSPSASIKGVCLAGWHIPSSEEWNELMTAVGGLPTAGTKLKSASGWNSNGNGTDEFGFSALPGGYGNSDGGFYDAGYYGSWWSATEYNGNYAYYRDILYRDEFARWDYYDKNNLFSVRCLQD